MRASSVFLLSPPQQSHSMQRCRDAVAKALAILLLLLQYGILDAHFILSKGPIWFCWLAVDLTVLVSWLVSLIVAYRQSRTLQKRTSFVDGYWTHRPDELPYAYIAWAVYAVVLDTKLVLLLLNHRETLHTVQYLNNRTLKLAISSTPLLFLCIVYAHHNARPNSKRNLFIRSLISVVTLDLFDSLDLLDIFFDVESEKAVPGIIGVLSVACTSATILLPILSLLELRQNQFDKSTSPRWWKMLYSCCVLTMVNVPNLVLRLLMWSHHDVDVPVLLSKNIVGIFLWVREMHELCVTGSTYQCPSCERHFSHGTWAKHKRTCRSRARQDELPDVIDSGMALATC